VSLTPFSLYVPYIVPKSGIFFIKEKVTKDGPVGGVVLNKTKKIVLVIFLLTDPLRLQFRVVRARLLFRVCKCKCLRPVTSILRRLSHNMQVRFDDGGDAGQLIAGWIQVCSLILLYVHIHTRSSNHLPKWRRTRTHGSKSTLK
jgi:hypothetical protein